MSRLNLAFITACVFGLHKPREKCHEMAGHMGLQIGSSGTKHWRFYDFGPKSVPPLVCLSGVAGSADIFYKQILFLSAKVHLCPASCPQAFDCCGAKCTVHDSICRD